MARAMFRTEWSLMYARYPEECPRHIEDASWLQFTDHAEAALHALRDPADRLICAANDVKLYLMPEITALVGYAKQKAKMKIRWQAMIDAALSQPPHHEPVK